MRSKLYSFIIAACLLGCTKAKDTTYVYKCTSTYQQDPFTVITKDTTFYHFTDNDANNYVRASSVGGWVTTCKKQ